ncbi:hypothetical protein L9F63_014064, partial [Diploptera punctata]
DLTWYSCSAYSSYFHVFMLARNVSITIFSDSQKTKMILVFSNRLTGSQALLSLKLEYTGMQNFLISTVKYAKKWLVIPRSVHFVLHYIIVIKLLILLIYYYTYMKMILHQTW